jgi:hypothetical protein
LCDYFAFLRAESTCSSKVQSTKTDKYLWKSGWRGFSPLEVAMDEQTKRQLLLNKGDERFIFRFGLGDEDLLLDALVAQAQDPRTSFDWFDAAVLSFKLTKSLITQADDLLAGDCPDMPRAAKPDA